MRESPTTKPLQELSLLVASLLPIVQLFFARLPEAVTAIFLAEEMFIGVSLVTLILSYVFIVAYQIRPWFSLTLPFQSKRVAEYQGYLNRLNQASELRKEMANSSKAIDKKKLAEFEKMLERAVKPPRALNPDNLLILLIAMVITSTVVFISLGIGASGGWAEVLQAVCYVIIIAASTLILSIYKRISDNDREWSETRTARTQKAVQLATINNTFANLPQVKYISSFENNQGLQVQYHVWVEYQEQKYEIITDNRADYLIAVYPFN